VKPLFILIDLELPSAAKFKDFKNTIEGTGISSVDSCQQCERSHYHQLVSFSHPRQPAVFAFYL
jgi:uncharacterized protein YcaQ